MKVKKSTVVRTVVFAVAIINQVLTFTGLNPLPFSGDEVGEWISGIFSVVTFIWAWWKNNSFSQAAIQADETLNQLRESED